MEITRRGFLKILGAAGLILAAPSQLIYPLRPVPEGLVAINDLRVITDYHLDWDKFLLRYDILYRRRGQDLTQIHVGAEVPADIDHWKPEQFIDRLHKPMVEALNDFLRKDGVRRDELISLPIPDYYEEPEWLTRMMREVKI
jgi:hypothetical protein